MHNYPDDLEEGKLIVEELIGRMGKQRVKSNKETERTNIHMYVTCEW